MTFAPPRSLALERIRENQAKRSALLKTMAGLSSDVAGEITGFGNAQAAQAAAAEKAKTEQAAAAERSALERRREDRADRESAARIAQMQAKTTALVPKATEEAPEVPETAAGVLEWMQPYLAEPTELSAVDVEGGVALSPEARAALDQVRRSTEEVPGPVAPASQKPSPFARAKPTGAQPKEETTKEKIEQERLRKARADADLAERKIAEMKRDPALANAPPTVLQFWGNVKGTAEAMRSLGSEVKPEDFSVNAKAQANLPTIAQSDRVREVTSKINRLVQRAGVSMEGGKLAEADIGRYREMLINTMDSYDGFVRATKTIAAELDQKVADEQAMFRGGEAAPADPQAAWLAEFKRLSATGLKGDALKDAIKESLRAKGILE